MPYKVGFLIVILIITITDIKCNGVPSGYYVQVDSEMKNATKGVGETMKFHCEITGHPVPEYNWLKDHKPINRVNSRRHSVEAIPWGSRLTIENLNIDDTGWYSCLASNHHDNQTTSAYLSVLPLDNLTGTGSKKNAGKRRKNRPYSDDDFEDGVYDYDDDDDKMEYEIVYVENGDSDRYDNMATKSQKKNQNKSRAKFKPDQTGRLSATCSIYTGKICRTAFNNQTVRLSVVNNVGSHSVVDKKLGGLHDAMLATSDDDLCTRIALTFLCRTSYKVCDSGSGLGAYIQPGGYFDQRDLAPLCKEDCRVFESDRCSSEREIIRLSLIVGDYQNLLIHDNMCSVGITLDQPTPPCVWGPHTSKKEESFQHGFPQMPYIAATLVAILLVACLALIIYGRRRKQQNKSKKQQHELESTKRKILLSKEQQPIISSAVVPPVSNFPTSTPVRTVSGVNVTFLYPIGNGHFGPVYAAQLLDQNSPTVIRQPQPQHVIAATLSEHSDLTSKSRFDCEMRALSSLNPDHPNVLRCVAVCPVGSPRSILFELVDGIDLKQHLHLSSSGIGGLDLMTVLDYCCQVARGFEYLAERNYYHGDLSARNVLVPRGVDRNLRITNLGVSRQIYESDYCIGPCGQLLPLRWCPAERVMLAEASPATEIWSFGVLLWEILSGGMRPYNSLSDAQLLEEINHGKQSTPQPLQSTCPEDILQILEDCWHHEPAKRVTAGVLRRNLEAASFRVFNNNVCLPNFNSLGNQRVINDAVLQHSYPYNPQNHSRCLQQPSKTQHTSPATSSNQTSSTSAINSPSRLNHALSLGERVDEGSDVNIKQYTC